MTELLEKQTDCKMYHISELTDKTARNIVSTDLLADQYHYEIWSAARVLCQHGYGDYTLHRIDDNDTIWIKESTHRDWYHSMLHRNCGPFYSSVLVRNGMVYFHG